MTVKKIPYHTNDTTRLILDQSQGQGQKSGLEAKATTGTTVFMHQTFRLSIRLDVCESV